MGIADQFKDKANELADRAKGAKDAMGDRNQDRESTADRAKDAADKGRDKARGAADDMRGRSSER
ncbi:MULTISPECIES: hypothetical protein [unclassified Streptomyces]|uniref:hypothetical protein n=1 Tax=unclassified Streptomyces TaxID=2593676 RepID=UPI000DABA660|nr:MULTISPECIES: hypothetical protein [unclassified Streptomyces]PZT72306.1 hypothetical protein DNK55_27525 [Streptomyces sp. AC1-42T]PZT81371.1 hypothetical protein DNK56_04040 [Streptomyces sp. AC1-42W]